ncbi:MAG: hypothetical protein M3Y08_03110 [Fibrobacterota bacterium]|nr:hypothetical protein [Fibrobacterota bacterium]
MLFALFLTKLAAVLTVIYAGINLHQLTLSYGHLLAKIAELRTIMAESEMTPRLIRLNLVFYVVAPIAYLTLLRVSHVEHWVLVLLALKFSITATLDIRVERKIMAGEDYTPLQHRFSRIDNVFNLSAAAFIIYLLLMPTRAGISA